MSIYNVIYCLLYYVKTLSYFIGLNTFLLYSLLYVLFFYLFCNIVMLDMVKNNKHDSILAPQNLSIEIFVEIIFSICIYVKEECSVFKKYILRMKTIHYPNTIRSHLVTIVPMALVYSKIYFKVEICSAL